MPKFKVGDKVRFLQSWGDIQKGEIREVTAYRGSDAKIHGKPVILEPLTSLEGYLPECISYGVLELVTAAPQPQTMQAWKPMSSDTLDALHYSMVSGRLSGPPMPQTAPKTPEPRACTCPTLLNGHHSGCPFVKEAA